MATREAVIENLRRILKTHYPHYIGQCDAELDNAEARTWRIRLYHGIVPITLTDVPEEYLLDKGNGDQVLALLRRVLN